MGRIYSVTADNCTITTATRGIIGIATAATDLAAGGRIKIKRVEVSQSANATSVMCHLAFSQRDQAATLTHATARTPVNIDIGGIASAIHGDTAGHSPMHCGTGSTVDTGGTYVDLWDASFNALNGYLWIPTPETEILVHNTSVFCVRFLTADPATLTGWSIGVIFEEL